MSTHAILGIKYPGGRVDGCYVHYDGGSMLPRIKDFISNNTTTGLAVLIAQAQASGGIRSFYVRPYDRVHGEPDCIPETEFLDDGVPYVINTENWEDDHFGTAYEYLVDYETATIHQQSRY